MLIILRIINSPRKIQKLTILEIRSPIRLFYFNLTPILINYCIITWEIRPNWEINSLKNKREGKWIREIVHFKIVNLDLWIIEYAVYEGS